MGTYIARRLIWTPFLLLMVTFVTFALGRFGPGDPVEILMGQYSNPEVVQRIREQKGLDDNIFTQYGRYIVDMSHLDFGESFKFRQPVAELLGKRMVVSAKLASAALVISISLGIPAGVFAALKQGTWWDTATVIVTLVGQSMPVFLTAPVMLIIFALKLQILPTHGLEGFFSTTIIMPALVMGIPGVAILARLTRASTLDVVNQDYVRTARAKGLAEMTVRRRHILRNALIPVITTLGFSLAGLASGAVIVETFFGIPGVGSLAIDSLFSRDYPVIMALTLLGTTFFVLANLLVDLTYPFLDPRIRLGGDYVAG